MSQSVYDLVVIGSGPGGQAAAELAAFLGHRSLIIERGAPGGVVTTTGGVPTKTLREAAIALSGVRLQRVYGVSGALPLETTLPIIRKRTEAVCDTLQRQTAGGIHARGVEYLNGSATMTSATSVHVTRADGSLQEVNARAIVVATGSRPDRPVFEASDDPDVYDTDRILSLRSVPESAVIVGGGPTGVEFSSVFAALGIPVTLVDRAPALLPGMDREVVALLVEELERFGVRLIQNATVKTVVRRGRSLTVTASDGCSVDAGLVLFAAGRRPNTAGLGLETAGVAVDAKGRITVDRYFRTSCPGIYAVGDVTGPTLASRAMQQGRAAACHALGLGVGLSVDDQPSAAVYGLPEVAGVGLTEEQAATTRIPYVVGRCALASTARGAIAGTSGLLKLIIHADNRKLLGVHCIGEIASELVALGHAVIHLGGAVDILLMLALNTPTYTSAYRAAAIDGLARLAESAGGRPGRAQFSAA